MPSLKVRKLRIHCPIVRFLSRFQEKECDEQTGKEECGKKKQRERKITRDKNKKKEKDESDCGECAA